MIDSFDFNALSDSHHMLEWLHPDPLAAIKQDVAEILNDQVPGSSLIGFHVTSEPDWLTTTMTMTDDSARALLSRTGVAFEFALSVKTPDGDIEDLSGVYTWVKVNLHDPENVHGRIWLDLGGTLKEFGSDGLLLTRLRYDQLEYED